MNVRKMTRVAILSAMAIVLMLFEIPLFFAPSFYKLDLSEIPVLVGTFAMGPFAGFIIEFVKIFGNLAINGTNTAFVGELANFITGISFILPAGFIYYKHKSRKGAIISLLVGTLSLMFIGALLNAFILLPAYSILMKMEISAFISMGSAINPLISNMFTFIIFAVMPFNLVKGVIVSIIVLFLYKHISFLLHDKEEEKSPIEE